MKGPYDDLLNLPHHVSRNHPPMDRLRRAAQFAPFAALTGHEDAVREAARLTEQRAELSEEEQEKLNHRLRLAVESGGVWSFTWFVPDTKKAGGAYVTRTGVIRHLDAACGVAELTDRTRIPLSELIAIQETDRV